MYTYTCKYSKFQSTKTNENDYSVLTSSFKIQLDSNNEKQVPQVNMRGDNNFKKLYGIIRLSLALLILDVN